MNILETVKNLIFIDGKAAPEKEKLLETVIDLTERKLCSRIGEESVPPALDYIVAEVAIIRFNRIGSEGMAREAQDGRTIEFNADDFAAYNDIIDAYLADKADGPGKRKVRFL
ncbi:phage head-tail connector protein [Peptoniphilus sp. HCN-40583]|uniref:phage head-tail connector protein n=1 Tax=Peptoniphilus sp. HCN-40583 TaxID=3134662 RepID=UPI0030BB6A2D